MNFRRYQNELIAGIALLVMLGAFLFKQGEISGKEEQIRSLQNRVAEMKEVVALKDMGRQRTREKGQGSGVGSPSLQSQMEPKKQKSDRKLPGAHYQ